ncbi:uncharacterized protein LOC112046359 isoform X1 [Bicyclus anynana]|uniref:Uncharacterized protein LOC112046359 isoform X1 n=1 Tax=Bicyclus anynana TaxID=110368 RepID=A0A6J1MT15_BICAN|nr:uncharacterized protein LOC112046359 isoform X1 [Bicyclus anynana]
MDCRSVLLFCLAVFLAILVTNTEGRTKKVVIHVPYKVKKIKHTHTVYKTVHHHHTHHDHLDHLEHLDHFEHLDHLPPADEHEHFHHMHLLDDAPIKSHTQPVPAIDIPEFLPDGPLNLPLELNNIPRDIPGIPKRLAIPLFRRDDKTLAYFVTSDHPVKHISNPTLASLFQ